ncbi:MAG: DUF3137 domain-containing protein [Hyphomonas sp.]
MAWDWVRLEQHEGFHGLKSLVDSEIIPEFELIPEHTEVEKGMPLSLRIVMGILMLGYVATFSAIVALTPDTFLGVLVDIVVFFGLFFIFLFLGLFVMRHWIAEKMAYSQGVFLARAKALQSVADHLGLSFVPAPGGAPELLKILARQSWAPPALREVAEVIDTHAGMDGPLEVFQASGLALSNVIVLGDEAQKANAVKQTHENLIIEDGFHGERGGIIFDMFEWVQKESEAPDIYHLIVTMKAPLHLNSLTQLRSRKTSWPGVQNGIKLQNVDLGPSEFEALYRLRSSDQVEARALFNPAVIERVIALAHGGAFKAVAKNDHIVFDIAGTNRFNLIDIATGEWSDESLRQSLTDLAEALDLVDVLAHAFMIRASRDGMTEPGQSDS